MPILSAMNQKHRGAYLSHAIYGPELRRRDAETRFELP